MKTFVDFEQFDNIDEKEKTFLEFTHVDELDIKFDFINYKGMIFYFYREKIIFNIVKKNKFIGINDNMWNIYRKKYKMENIIDVFKFLKTMIDKYLGLYEYKPDTINRLFCSLLIKLFKQ